MAQRLTNSSTCQCSRTTKLNVLLFLCRDPHCIFYHSYIFDTSSSPGLRASIQQIFVNWHSLMECSRISWEAEVPFSVVFPEKDGLSLSGLHPNPSRCSVSILAFQVKSPKTRICHCSNFRLIYPAKYQQFCSSPVVPVCSPDWHISC